MSETRPDRTRATFFIHVMKTAGTTLAVHSMAQFDRVSSYPNADLDLAPNEDGADLGAYASIARLRALTAERRDSLRWYSGHFPYSASLLFDPVPLRLTLVREPVSRTISVLRHFQRIRTGQVRPDGNPDAAPHRFADMALEAIYDDPVVHAAFVLDHQVRMFSVSSESRDAFATTWSYDEITHRLATGSPTDLSDDLGQWVRDADERRVALETAKRNLAFVDVVGLSDEYGAFVEELRDRHGWWADVEFDTSARANRAPQTEAVPNALVDRITRDCHLDIEFFEFARELVGERRRARVS